jgi:hypothetical protein
MLSEGAVSLSSFARARAAPYPETWAARSAERVSTICRTLPGGCYL